MLMTLHQPAGNFRGLFGCEKKGVREIPSARALIAG